MGGITAAMRDVLIDHMLQGEVPLVHRNIGGSRAETNRMLTTSALLKRGLLQGNGINWGNPRPDRTLLTERGREVLATILGDDADALARANWTESEAWKAAAGKARPARPARLPEVIDSSGLAVDGGQPPS